MNLDIRWATFRPLKLLPQLKRLSSHSRACGIHLSLILFVPSGFRGASPTGSLNLELVG